MKLKLNISLEIKQFIKKVIPYYLYLIKKGEVSITEKVYINHPKLS